MIDVIYIYGSVKGIMMGVVWILWCYFFVKGGIDYVLLKFCLMKNFDEIYYGLYMYWRNKKIEVEKDG